MSDLPRTTYIVDRTVECEQTVTLSLEPKFDFVPGQFLMIWLPRINEKPFSIAGVDEKGILITVRQIGDFTEKLAALEAGSKIGVRGPYGNGFKPVENCCIVTGGSGIASVAPLMDRYPKAPVLYGENTAGSRLYRDRFPDLNFYTMDGTSGKKGFPTDGLEETIRKTRCEMLYCCGPEPMLVKALEIADALGVKCQASIERYMKCGIGICGQCGCGEIRVCVEGPVLDDTHLRENKDFGRCGLDAKGSRNYL